MNGVTLSLPHTPSWNAQWPLSCFCASEYCIFTVLLYLECNFCYWCYKRHFISLSPSLTFCCCFRLPVHTKEWILLLSYNALFCSILRLFIFVMYLFTSLLTDSASPFLCSYVLLFREVFDFLIFSYSTSLCYLHAYLIHSSNWLSWYNFFM